MNTEMRQETGVKPEFHCKLELAKDLQAEATPWGFRKYERIQCRNKGGKNTANCQAQGESLRQVTISCSSCSYRQVCPLFVHVTAHTAHRGDRQTHYRLRFILLLCLPPASVRTMASPQRGHPVHGIACAPSGRHEEDWDGHEHEPLPAAHLGFVKINSW